jgi:NitT/TauT family transport system substrate-binding protein
MVSRTFFYVPLWAAQHQGFFADEGISVEALVLDSLRKITNGLKAGSLQMGIGSPEGIIADIEAGGSLRIVAGNATRLTHSLIALKTYRAIEDLRGARLGVASIEEGTTFILREMLAQHGLHAPADYVLDAVGGAPTRWKALQEGRIDAGLQSIPLNYLAEDAGYPNLGEADAYVPDYPFSTIHTDRDWAQTHPDVVVHFLQAMIRGTQWLYRNQEAAVALIAEEMEISLAYAERGWRHYTSGRILPLDLGISEAGLSKVIDIMGRAGSLTGTHELRPDKYLELDYLQRARR